MITRSGIGTLAAGGGIVAVVVCLLVGFQLLLLGSEIGTLMEADPAGVDSSAGAWHALVRVSGLLSLTAAALVALLVVAHRLGWRRAVVRDGQDTSGIEDVSVRIFEVDPALGTVEVSADDRPPLVERPSSAKSTLRSPEEDSLEILEEIGRVSGSTPAPSRPSWRRFLARFLGYR